MMTARKMAEMSESLPERSGYAAEHALWRQLGTGGIRKQDDARAQCDQGNKCAPAHGPIPLALARPEQ